MHQGDAYLRSTANHFMFDNFRLGELIAQGVAEAQARLCDGKSSSKHLAILPIVDVDFVSHVKWADAVILGSSSIYGNVAGPLLTHIEKTWDWSADCSAKVRACIL